MIACRHGLEFQRSIGNQTGEDIEPAGRAFRIRHRADIALQSQTFLQLDDIDASTLQHGAAGQINLMHGKSRQLVLDPHLDAGKKGGLYPPGAAAEPQIKACGLNLAVGARCYR